MTKATVTLKLITGTIPNYIKCDKGAKEREAWVDVRDLTDKEVEAYIRQWGHDFRNHIAKRKLTKRSF